LAPNLAPLAGHMSMAVVVGSAAMFAGSHMHSGSTHTPTHVNTTPAAVAPGSSAGSVETGAARAASTDGAPASVAHAAAVPASQAGAPGAAPAKPLIAVQTDSATVGSSNESSSYSQQAPVSHNDGHLVAGIDPPAVGQDTVASVFDYVAHTTDRSKG